MKTKKLNYINFIATVFLISLLFFVAYFLSNNETFLSKYFINKNNNLASNSIINNRYNKSLEGSIKDNVFDFNAEVISVKTARILRKKLDEFNELNISNLESSYNFIKPLNERSFDSLNSRVAFTNGNNTINFALFNNRFKNNAAKTKNYDDHSVLPLSVREDNRFKGMVGEYLKTKKPSPTKNNDINENNTKLLTKLNKWDKPNDSLLARFKDLNPKIKLDLRKDEDVTFSNLVKNVDKKPDKIDENSVLISYSPDKHKIKIVKRFSKDPLQSVIQNILIPSGLPKTPANVDAVAKGMGLPSGALGSNISLANSLGISVDELSNPNTKLPSYIVGSINKNENYIGNKLDVNNTTLFDYYNSALKNNFTLDFQK